MKIETEKWERTSTDGMHTQTIIQRTVDGVKGQFLLFDNREPSGYAPTLESAKRLCGDGFGWHRWKKQQAS